MHSFMMSILVALNLQSRYKVSLSLYYTNSSETSPVPVTKRPFGGRHDEIGITERGRWRSYKNGLPLE